MTVIAVNNAKMIDTGASVNVMDERTYEMNQKPALMRHRGPRIMPYGGGTPLHVLGVCDVTLESKSTVQCHQFHVIKGAQGSLIGFSTGVRAREHCQQNRLQLGRQVPWAHEGHWETEGSAGQTIH